MEYAPVVLFAIVALGVASIVYRRIKRGSWTGAFVGGRIRRTTGKIALSSSSVASQTLTVHAMSADDGEDFVALTFTAKAPLAASMQPYKLTRTQALELASHLTEAASEVESTRV